EAGLDKTVQTLGRSWDITAPGGLSLKLHASCYLSQWCVDAALYLVNTHDIKPDEVARVTCALPGAMGGTLKSHRPGTGFDGMISLEYCIAAALLDRQVGLEQFTDEKVARPEARVLLEKVETVFPPDTRGMSLADAFKYPNAVTIELKNGRVYRHEVDYPKGDIRNPLTEEEGAAKFRSFAGETLSADGKEAVIAATRRLETLSKTSELTRLLAGREQPVRA
ncbi:MAG: MmgE/PrpD family protein, partial [Chloroflexi bacterium]|nr:MmgE/PrpD family protein [Chloroflexota bacterium]